MRQGIDTKVMLEMSARLVPNEVPVMATLVPPIAGPYVGLIFVTRGRWANARGRISIDDGVSEGLSTFKDVQRASHLGDSSRPARI